MSIEQTTPREAIQKHMDEQIERIHKLMIEALEYLGEKTVRAVRDTHRAGTFMDQTGNLRASTGYVIVENGRVLKSSSFDSSNGGSAGKTYAELLASQHMGGMAIIVVAGMNYAKYVHAMGYDVITNGEELAKRELPNIIKQLNKAIKG